MKKNCAECGKNFEAKGHAKYCSAECSSAAKKNREAELRKKHQIVFKKFCEYCGTEFYTTNSIKRYCSAACQKAINIKRQTKKSELPKKIFGRGKCYACRKKFARKFANEKFCSDRCRMNYFKA